MRRFAIALAAAVLLAAPLAHAEDRIVVFAAASLKNALDTAAAKYHAAGGVEVAASYGGSMPLATQLIAGAPADVFISADEASMDEAAKGSAIKPESRVDFLSNTLVLVVPKSAAFDSLSLARDALAKALGDQKLATGDIATVPVGKYAKAALTKLGLWETIEPHLALTSDVRAALAFVARGEAPLGIVYATDAAAEPKVKIVATFPADSHPPIPTRRSSIRSPSPPPPTAPKRQNSKIDSEAPTRAQCSPPRASACRSDVPAPWRDAVLAPAKRPCYARRRP